jgi:hypothetical protein
MDEAEFRKFLDDPEGARPTSDVLGGIVARRRKRQQRQYKIAASSAIVVALAAAGVGIGVSAGGNGQIAAGGGPPAGLRWVTSGPRNGTIAPAAAGANLGWTEAASIGNKTGTGGSGSALGTAPGEFGWVGGGTRAPGPYGAQTGTTGGPEVPAATQTSADGQAFGPNLPGTCRSGCQAVIGGDSAKTLFTRSVDGLSITVQLVTFVYGVAPLHLSTVTPIGINPGVAQPLPAQPAPQPGATGGSTSTGSSSSTAASGSGHSNASGGGAGSSGAGSSGSPPNSSVVPPYSPPPQRPGSGRGPTPPSPPVVLHLHVAKIVPVQVLCPTPAELFVTVRYGQSSLSLAVPAGGNTAHAFAAVASAAAEIAPGQTVALGVAETSGHVASGHVTSVSAGFQGGASDSMGVVDGWAVLAHRFSGSEDTAKAGELSLTAKSSSGSVLETANLPAAGSLAEAPPTTVCNLLIVPTTSIGAPGAVAGSSGSGGSVGSSGSGSTGSGSTGSGSTGSGSTGSGSTGSGSTGGGVPTPVANPAVKTNS